MITKSFKFTRFWIVCASIGNIFGAMILGIIYFYLLNKYNNGELAINNDNSLYNKIIEILLMKSYGDIGSYKSLFLIIVMFNLFVTVICNWGLIKYAIQSNDGELCANKWSLAVLSLSLGGFFTAFALTWLPNINIKATKNARVTIVRYLGTSWLLSSLFSLIAILTFYNNITHKEWNVFYLNNNDLINIDGNKSKQLFTIIITILSTLTISNFILVPWFYNQNTIAHIIANTKKGKWYRFISTIYTIIVTFLLIMQIFISFLKLIEAIKNIFVNNKNNNILNNIISLFNLSMILMNTFFMIYLIVTIIKGLWKKSDNYIINFSQYNIHSKNQQY